MEARLARWHPAWSRAAALRAVRTTIVMPGLFALTFRGFGNLQMALFAGFGSFATLVLVSFEGTPRDKLLAHLNLAVAGSVLLVIGTAVTPRASAGCSSTSPSSWPANRGPGSCSASPGAASSRSRCSGDIRE